MSHLLAAAFCGLCVLASIGCESVRPNTVKRTGQRYEEATRSTLLDSLNWQSWPTVTLAGAEHVAQNRHNWRGMRDASAQVGVEVYGDRLTIAGQVMDDHPLEQPYAEARRPNWWKVPVAGDAIEVRFVPMEDRYDAVRLLLEFGADGTEPKFTVLEAGRGQIGPVLGAVVGRERTPVGYEFILRVNDMNDFGLRPLWSVAYRIEVTLHDYDTDPSQYVQLFGSTLSRPSR